MKNCLVTTYKTSVNNSSLKKLGIIELHVDAVDTEVSAYQHRLFVEADGSVIVKVDNGGYFIVGESSSDRNDPSKRKTSYTITNTLASLYFANVDCNIEIENKYGVCQIYTHRNYPINKKLIQIDLGSIGKIDKLNILDFAVTDTHGDISLLADCANLKEIELQSSLVTGNLKDISGLTNLEKLRLAPGITANVEDVANMTSLKVLDMRTANVSGDISNLARLTNLENINFFQLPVTGNISVLTNMSNATYVMFQDSRVSGNIDDLGGLQHVTTMHLNNTNVGGTLEGFVAAQIAGGRSTVTQSSPIAAYRIIQYATFGGNNYVEYNCFVTWESASKIAVFAGASSLASCNKVYCKGYGTQSQAEAAFPDKTVVRVDA